MTTDLDLKTRIAILEKDLEIAKKNEAITKIELDVTRAALMRVISSIIGEVVDR